MENLDAGNALQGGFYAVYDVHQAILPTAAGVGQAVLRWRHVRHTAGSAQVADPDYRFARRDRSRAGGHRVHLGLLVATTTQRRAAAGGFSPLPACRLWGGDCLPFGFNLRLHSDAFAIVPVLRKRLLQTHS
jgi:hypothetical protein